MESGDPQIRRFSYRARTPGGQFIGGVIESSDSAAAMKSLKEMGLVEIQVEAAAKGTTLGGQDFMAFNQQLAQLAGASLPVEEGLHLLAGEMRNGRLRRAIEQVAEDMQRGKSLPEALNAHRDQFPPLYGRLVEAGIRSGNLQGVLLNLGRHLSLLRRMQAMLWGILTYPVLILGMFFVVIGFVLVAVIPRVRDLMAGTAFPWWRRDQDHSPNLLTQVVLWMSDGVQAMGLLNTLIGLLVILGLLVLGIWLFTRNPERREKLQLSLPVLGAVFRRNLIARWCDAVGLGVNAGMDLPSAIRLADDAIASAGLREDGEVINAVLSEGRSLSDVTAGRIIPPLVMAGMEAASARNDLPQAMRSLSASYQEQAESALGAVQTLLTPAILFIIGGLVFLLMAAVMVPLINLF